MNELLSDHFVKSGPEEEPANIQGFHGLFKSVKPGHKCHGVIGKRLDEPLGRGLAEQAEDECLGASLVQTVGVKHKEPGDELRVHPFGEQVHDKNAGGGHAAAAALVQLFPLVGGHLVVHHAGEGVLRDA